MDKKQARLIRLKILDLLDQPFPNHQEIERLGKLLGEPEEKEVNSRGKNKNYYKPFITVEEYMDLRNKGLNKQQISGRYGVTIRQLDNVLSAYRYRKDLLPGVLKVGRTLTFDITVKQYEDYKKQGLKDFEIAELYGMQPTAVTMFKKRNNLTMAKKWGNRTDEISKEEFIRLKSEGVQITEISKILGISRNSLYHLRKQWGLLG